MTALVIDKAGIQLSPPGRWPALPEPGMRISLPQATGRRLRVCAVVNRYPVAEIVVEDLPTARECAARLGIKVDKRQGQDAIDMLTGKRTCDE